MQREALLARDRGIANNLFAQDTSIGNEGAIALAEALKVNDVLKSFSIAV